MSEATPFPSLAQAPPIHAQAPRRVPSAVTGHILPIFPSFFSLRTPRGGMPRTVSCHERSARAREGTTSYIYSQTPSTSSRSHGCWYHELHLPSPRPLSPEALQPPPAPPPPGGGDAPDGSGRSRGRSAGGCTSSSPASWRSPGEVSALFFGVIS